MPYTCFLLPSLGIILSFTPETLVLATFLLLSYGALAFTYYKMWFLCLVLDLWMENNYNKAGRELTLAF